jgi:hypothetical protein
LQSAEGLTQTGFFWLQACFHFKLNLSALAIAVRLLDRFLDVCLVPVSQRDHHTWPCCMTERLIML